MRLLSAALLLLSRACLVAQELALDDTPGLRIIECTPSDAAKFAGHDQQQCFQLDDTELRLKCNQCYIDRERAQNRDESEIANMVLEQKAAAVRADCDTSANTYFDKNGAYYDQSKKKKWRRKCYETYGGIIKPEDRSGPFYFEFDDETKKDVDVCQSDETETDDSLEDAARFSISTPGAWSTKLRIDFSISTGAITIVAFLFAFVARALYMMAVAREPKCRCREPSKRCEKYDWFRDKGDFKRMGLHYNDQDENGKWVKVDPPPGSPIYWVRENPGGRGHHKWAKTPPPASLWRWIKKFTPFRRAPVVDTPWARKTIPQLKAELTRRGVFFYAKDSKHVLLERVEDCLREDAEVDDDGRDELLEMPEPDEEDGWD